MGRFYKTVGANPLSYMYEMNEPLMEKSLMANDAAITDTINQDKLLEQSLITNYKYLQQDEPDAQRVMQGYNKKIEDIATAIKQDPVNWRKHTEKIDTVKRDLMSDFQFGEIGKHVSNYAKRQADFDAIDKQVEVYNKAGGKDKSGNAVGISPEAAIAYKRHWDDQFTGTKYNAKGMKDYNPYRGGTAMNDMDIRKTLSDGFDKLKADGVIQVQKTLTGGEEYFNKVTGKWEGLTPDKILGLVRDNFQGNQQLQQYIKERSDIGMLKNMYYTDDVKDTLGNTIHKAGEMINPYDVKPQSLSSQEQNNIASQEAIIAKTKNAGIKQRLQDQLSAYKSQLGSRTKIQWNPESGLTPIFRGITNQYSYSKTENGNELSGGTNWGTRFKEQNQNMRQIKDLTVKKQISDDVTQRMKDLQTEQLKFEREKLEAQKEIAEKKASGKPGSPATSKKDDAKAIELPTETGVSRVATHSFNDVTTLSNNNEIVPLLSPEGLAGDVDHFKEQIANIDNRVKGYDAIIGSNASDAQKAVAKTSKEKALLERKQLDSDLGVRRDWYSKTEEAVLSNNPRAGTPLSTDEIKIYNDFKDDRDGKQYLAFLAKQKSNLFEYMKAHPESADVKIDEINAYSDRWEKYLAAKGRVEKNKRTFLSSVAEGNVIDTDAIVPNQKDSDAIKDLMFSNPTGLQLYDEDGKITNRKLDNKGLGKGESNMSFSGTDNLIDYVNKHADQVTMKVTKVGNTTKLGNGNAIAEIRFTDKNGEIPAKPYYVVLSPEIQKSLGSRFSANKNPDVAKVGNKLNDNEGNNIRNQILNPTINNYIGQDNNTEKEFNISVPNAQGDKVQLTVTRFPNSSKINVQMSKDGKLMPFPFGSKTQTSGIPGMFNSIDNFIDNYQDVKANGVTQ